MSDLPTVSLAGQPYPVKLLVLRQVRIVQPRMQKLSKMDVRAVTEENFDDLIEIIYQAVCPSLEDKSRDAFMNMPITLPEMLAALPVIAQQSGMVRADTSGEARAGNP
jgi:hypothetical protein